MNIGIDARLINETGIGTYIRNLIKQLGALDRKNRYIVYIPKAVFGMFPVPNARWEKRLANVRWHSVREQFVMPWLCIKDHLDILHVPYHNIPIFYPGRFVVTIHDLTILHFDTGKATTLPVPLYRLRRTGYFVVLAVGLKRAAHIIAVSHATRGEIIDHFRVKPEKISVTYEAAQKSLLPAKRLIDDRYILYVGNAYPHKNLEFLIRAFGEYSQNDTRTRLVLVGNDDFFYRRLRLFIQNLGIADRVTLFGPADTDTLGSLYQHAIALVVPSLMEGFGLPPLEALVQGCPVICSDIPVFREVLEDVPLYFSPISIHTLVEALGTAVRKSQSLRQKQMEDAKQLLEKYSWQRMAQATLAIYRKAAHGA